MTNSNKKKIKSKNTGKFTITKFIFDKLYVLVIMVFIIMLAMFYYNNEITNKTILAALKEKPKNYSVTEAIENKELVNYYGVVTNLDMLYKFIEKCNEGKSSSLTYVICNNLNEITIKTILYKNNKIYVNIDNTRTSSKNKEIKTFKFTDYELIDEEAKLTLILSNNKETMNFFEYIK